MPDPTIQTLCTLLAGLCALAYLPLTGRAPGLVRSLVKTASVALLAALAAQAPPLLAYALALCALGDWLLSRPGDRAFAAGICAFAAGHLAYAALFLTHPGADPLRLMQPPQAWIVAALAGLGILVAAALAPRAGALRGPVLAYVPVILGMGIAALALPAAGPLALTLPAALAFIASDLVLAIEKFMLPLAHPARRIAPYAVWPLYWGAQAGFLAAFT
ncbi:MAG: lysoplasmalogenase family protein [Jhaorihella sp.]